MNTPALLSHLLAAGVFVSMYPLGLLCLCRLSGESGQRAGLAWHVLALAAGRAGAVEGAPRWSGPARGFVLLLLAGSAALYAGYPKESILAERDEGVYTLH